jgi:3-phosphoshikimate 1-carboxyvinyltransferase
MPSLKQVSLPVSKSLYIRKLICDFLYNGCIGEIPSDASEDIRIVHHCLTCISQDMEGGVKRDESVLIDVYDCGAAYRFLMAVLAITPGQWLLTGTEHLLQRPIEELVEALRSIGADIQWCPYRDAINRVSTNDNCACWQIHGKPLHASEMTIDCTRSGQFATALLLISDKIGLKNLNILPQNPSSFVYIAMTKEIMNGKADLEANHMGDWSAAVYWYARLLLEGQMQSSHRSHFSSGVAPCVVPESYKLLHLDLHSIQSDAVLARWFADWGIESRQEEDGVVISYNEQLIKPQEVVELDMSQNVDLVPVLACLACIWPKTMIFKGVANLKYKESDRLKVIQEQLSPFAIIEINSYNGIPNNQLVIGPIDTHSSYSNSSCGFSFNAHNDHRFVMGFSLFALKGKVQIKGFDCVRKSYPNFNAEGVIAGSDIVG